MASRVDPDEDVGHGHVLELGVLGVRKIDLGLPDGLDQVGVVEVERFDQRGMVETWVRPMLTEIQIHLVILKKTSLFFSL